MDQALIQAALRYHSMGRRKGKIEVNPTKPCATAYDLSMAYSPGVGAPCLEIAQNPEAAYEYTAKGNLVAVISNGTAVLGLGDLGALAGKPVMEGKGNLFKRFADIDVFDIELNSQNTRELIRTIQILAPTFGGINLEDIKAPECFEIEEALKETLDIPVFHDDQHGTAIICTAALLNACDIQGKKLSDIKVVFNGAGASAFSCARMFVSFGVQKKNVRLCDSKGVIYKGRTSGMNKYKEEFAVECAERSLADCFKGADVFVGLSVGGAVSKDMIAAMAPKPIVFAMANPDPEITYPDATSVRDDLIMATGRSDYPNQVNNVMGFPFIFRGALDVRARAINEDMKRAAALALSNLAKEPVPDSVSSAYGGEKFTYGKHYIIPKPFDPRVLWWVAPAVAKAAMESGVARRPVDMEEYCDSLKRIFNPSRHFIDELMEIGRQKKPRLVFAEGEDPKILRAAASVANQEFARPVVIGDADRIKLKCKQLEINFHDFQIIDPLNHPRFEEFIKKLTEQRRYKGMTADKARQLFLTQPNYFGAMMVHEGEAEGLLSGIGMSYPDAIRPALQVIGMKKGLRRVYGLYIMVIGEHIKIFADTTVNEDPTAEQLAEAGFLSAKLARAIGLTPRVAMLSFGHFGDVDHAEPKKMRRAAELLREMDARLPVVGEIHADYAVTQELVEEAMPWFGGTANVLIFPNLAAGNIGYKLVQKLANADAIGPILVGMNKPFNAIARAASETDIINLAAVTAAGAKLPS